MRPFDPRLLRYARSSRRFFILGGVVSLADAAAIVLLAWGISTAIARLVGTASPGPVTPTTGIAPLGSAPLGIALAAIAVAGVLRALFAWLSEALGARAAVQAKSELRQEALAALRDSLGSDAAPAGSARAATVLGHGLDALDAYYSDYLPKLLRTAIVIPVLAVTMFLADPLSAVIVAVTLPIIPAFMILIGMATRTVQRRQWNALTTLASRFVDAVGGLATLKIFGREHRLSDSTRRSADAHRRETMAVLRISFVSGFALELMASLSVALVAVSIGFRLVDGGMLLVTGLFVLLLAPDALLPLRQVGASFHASTEGAEAAADALALIEGAGRTGPAEVVAAKVVPAQDAWTPGRSTQRLDTPTGGTRPLPAADNLVAEGVRAFHAGQPVTREVSHTFRRGTVTVLSGESGAGKSSFLDALAGLTSHSGSFRIGQRHVSDAVVAERDWLAWAPQTPFLVDGTVQQNVTLGREHADDADVSRALDLAGAGSLDPERPVGRRGTDLSGGEAQRVGLARCIYRALSGDVQVVAIDEPTSALDAETEERVARGIRHLADRGLCVLLVTHRPALAAIADDTLPIGAQEVLTP